MSGGGDRVWSENGDEWQMGGLTKFSPTGPQGKNPGVFPKVTWRLNNVFVGNLFPVT